MGLTWQEGKEREEEADGLKKSGELGGFMLMRVVNRLVRSGIRGRRPDICS